MPRLALANLVVAALLTGLIWTIGVVHYPLFDGVPPDVWPRYEARHQTRITIIVLPLMLANLALAAALLRDPASRRDRLAWANAALVASVFAGTGLVFAPMHGELQDAWDAGLHSLLVALNWLRIAAWSAQTMVAWLLVARALAPLLRDRDRDADADVVVIVADRAAP